MSIELTSIIGILIISWILLLILDLAVSGLIRLSFGIAFRKAFLWGLLSLAIPPVLMAYGVLIERNLYHVKNVEICFEGLPESFQTYMQDHLHEGRNRSAKPSGR